MVDGIIQRLKAQRVCRGAEFREEGCEVVILQPSRYRQEIRRGSECALLVRAGRVVVEVEVHIEGEVVEWVDDVEHSVGVGGAFERRVAACVVEPAVGAGEAVAGHEDELLGAGYADGGEGGLVVGEDEGSGHVVGFVHEAEDDVGVDDEAGGELGPEGGEVFSCG